MIANRVFFLLVTFVIAVTIFSKQSRCEEAIAPLASFRNHLLNSKLPDSIADKDGAVVSIYHVEKWIPIGTDWLAGSLCRRPSNFLLAQPSIPIGLVAIHLITDKTYVFTSAESLISNDSLTFDELFNAGKSNVGFRLTMRGDRNEEKEETWIWPIGKQPYRISQNGPIAALFQAVNWDQCSVNWELEKSLPAEWSITVSQRESDQSIIIRIPASEIIPQSRQLGIEQRTNPVSWYREVRDHGIVQFRSVPQGVEKEREYLVPLDSDKSNFRFYEFGRSNPHPKISLSKLVRPAEQVMSVLPIRLGWEVDQQVLFQVTTQAPNQASITQVTSRICKYDPEKGTLDELGKYELNQLGHIYWNLVRSTNPPRLLLTQFLFPPANRDRPQIGGPRPDEVVHAIDLNTGAFSESYTIKTDHLIIQGIHNERIVLASGRGLTSISLNDRNSTAKVKDIIDPDKYIEQSKVSEWANNLLQSSDR